MVPSHAAETHLCCVHHISHPAFVILALCQLRFSIFALWMVLLILRL